MRFVDQTRIYVKSGDGGNGCISFRREKYVEFGGPNGGDGGRGGNIYVEAITGLNTLVDFRYKRHFKAGKGQHGMGKNMTGGTGKDIVMQVPVGTQIFDEEQEFMIADLTRVGDRILLARGGEGGLGNTRFKSSINRAPRRNTPGQMGEERWVFFRLKLIADAGLLGLPNAGKSTFLSAVTRAKPKIASYPFTTIAPQLGVVGYKNNEFVLADIPGLIEGASEGHGLGHRFLGHVERCGVLLHLIDATAEDVVGHYNTIMQELRKYDADLSEKPMVIGLNKSDASITELLEEQKTSLEEVSGAPVMILSGATGAGVEDILGALWDIVKIDQERRRLEEDEKIPSGLDRAESIQNNDVTDADNDDTDDNGAQTSDWSPI